MSKRKFYSDEKLIDEFAATLTEVESDGWTTKYLNKSTGEYHAT